MRHREGAEVCPTIGLLIFHTHDTNIIAILFDNALINH